MSGLGIGYQSPGGAAAAISPASGPVGTTFNVVGAPANAQYQWYLNGTAISGATSSSYTSTALGALTCAIIPTATVTVAAPTVTTAPTLSTSSPRVGTAVVATPGVYTGSPTVTAQWFYADTGAPISGATTTSYTPVSADLGHSLKYIETATNLGGLTTQSATTGAVTPLTLGALSLSTTSFPQGVSPSTLLATISGNTSGSTITISSADTSGYFAVSGTNLYAGLNYDNMVAGATPTVALTETLAGASNSPKLSMIGVTINTAATVVSASNRTRFQLSAFAQGSAKSTRGRTLHMTSVAVSNLQPYYANWYINGSILEVPNANPVTIRASIITNVIGSPSTTSPMSENQSGATLNIGTWTALRTNSGATIYGDTTGANMRQVRTYAQFVADGGSISTTTVTDDTITVPPGYSVAPTIPVSLTAGQFYYVMSEQAGAASPWNVVQNAINYYGQRYGGVNTTGDYSGTYSGGPVDPSNLVQTLNWTAPNVSPGALSDPGPFMVLATSAAGAKTVLVDGSSIFDGHFDYGDVNGTCGGAQRALVGQGISVLNSAVSSSTASSVKENPSGGNMRLLAQTLATGGMVTDAPMADISSWPAAGTYTPADPNNTSAPTNAMSGMRWYFNRARGVMPAGAKIVATTRLRSLTTPVSVAAITGATYSSTTITYTCSSTSNLTNGEVVQVLGMAPSVYNALGPVTVVDSTHFSIVAASAPTAAPTTATGTVQDGFQSIVGQSAASATYFGASSPGVLHNDFIMTRNSYAGYTLTPSAGDPDAAWDNEADAGSYCDSSGHWLPGPSYEAVTVDGTHYGWLTNQNTVANGAGAHIRAGLGI